jgi:hypothetical protein
MNDNEKDVKFLLELETLREEKYELYPKYADNEKYESLSDEHKEIFTDGV